MTIVSITLKATCQPAPSTSLTAHITFSTVPEARIADEARRDIFGRMADGAVNIVDALPTLMPTLLCDVTATSSTDILG